MACAHCIPTRRGRPHPSQTDKAIAHGLSSYRSKFTLIKAQFFILNTADERGTSDETEATRQPAEKDRSDDCDALQ